MEAFHVQSHKMLTALDFMWGLLGHRRLRQCTVSGTTPFSDMGSEPTPGSLPWWSLRFQNIFIASEGLG
jgi:hypothetical protein